MRSKKKNKFKMTRRQVLKAGMICGIVGVVLAILSIFWMVFVIGLSSVLGAVGT